MSFPRGLARISVPIAVALLSAEARAQEAPAPIDSSSAPTPPRSDNAPTGPQIGKTDRPGFGQDEGDAPREERVRFEGSLLGAIFDSSFRYGKSGRSNRFDPQAELSVPRWTTGARGAFAFKVFGFYGAGVNYISLTAEGPVRPAGEDVRMGIPARELPQSARASARVEFQQLAIDLRLWLVDNADFRAECYAGFGWVSYRLGIHPAAPFPLPQGGASMAISRSTEAFFTPVLGIVFVWNPTSRVGLYIDTILNYFSWSRPGSSAGLTRAGVRLRLAYGLEAVLGIFVVSGQVYDLRDAFGSRASGHEFKQSSWIGGGPELGLSSTF
ncbi:hypothetical protein HY251_04715 [bacterium]|nr:hypothetical protein [bacterium]